MAAPLNKRVPSLVSSGMIRSLILTLVLCGAALAQSAPQRQFLLRIEPLRKDFTIQNMTEAEKPVLAQHGAYLKALQEKGVLTFAGQVFDPKGLWGIIVVNAPDAETAQHILNDDPSIKSKIFQGEAIPFRVFERAAK